MSAAPPTPVNTQGTLLQGVEELTNALMEQCHLWRDHGWAWWPAVQDPPPPEGWAWSVPPRPEQPVRKRLATGRVGDFSWEIRAEDPDGVGFAVKGAWEVRANGEMSLGYTSPKPLPQDALHLLDILQRACPPAAPQRLRVVVALDGMAQNDRREWRKLLQYAWQSTDGEPAEGRPPHVSWTTAFRDGEALLRYGPRLLYVGKRRSPRTRQELLAHLLLYACQAGMASREEVDPWLKDYIKGLLPRTVATEIRNFQEELL